MGRQVCSARCGSLATINNCCAAHWSHPGRSSPRLVCRFVYRASLRSNRPLPNHPTRSIRSTIHKDHTTRSFTKFHKTYNPRKLLHSFFLFFSSSQVPSISSSIITPPPNRLRSYLSKGFHSFREESRRKMAVQKSKNPCVKRKACARAVLPKPEVVGNSPSTRNGARKSAKRADCNQPRIFAWFRRGRRACCALARAQVSITSFRLDGTRISPEP